VARRVLAPVRMPRRASTFAALLATASIATATSASASEGGPSLALLLGYGVSTPEPNLLGPGLGFRAGYTFDSGIYVGVLGLAHLGSHDEGESEVRHHAQSARAELGYDFSIFRLTLRPSLRAGGALVTTARDVDGRFVSPELGVGMTLMIPLGRVFLGADLEGRFFTRLVNNGDNSYSVVSVGAYGTLGYRF